MAFRPTKTVSKATADEIRRVATISDEELERTSTTIVPGDLDLPELKIWLKIDGASDSGTLTIPDALGGSSATQPTALNKPTVGTTGNGLPKLTCAAGTGLILPISAGINNTSWFGMAFWAKATSTSAADFYSAIRTGASGLANLDRQRFGVTNQDDLASLIWVSQGNTRRAQTNTSRATVFQNVWKFLCFEFIGTNASEATRFLIKDMGAPVAAPAAVIYDDSQGTAGSNITSLVSVTGSAILFNRTTAYANGFIGDIGPDIFFYDPTTMTQDKRVSLAQHRIPTG